MENNVCKLFQIGVRLGEQRIGCYGGVGRAGTCVWMVRRLSWVYVKKAGLLSLGVHLIP